MPSRIPFAALFLVIGGGVLYDAFYSSLAANAGQVLAEASVCLSFAALSVVFLFQDRRPGVR